MRKRVNNVQIKEIAYRYYTLSQSDLEHMKLKFKQINFDVEIEELLNQLRKSKIEDEFLKELKKLD